MSERDDDERADDEESAPNDTVPEEPAASGAGTLAGQTDDGVMTAGEAPAQHGGEASAPASDDDTAPPHEPPSSQAPALQETPERAGRRVERAGLRLGTRLALGLVFASVLPTAVAAGAVLLLEPPALQTLDELAPAEPLTLDDVTRAKAELTAAEAALTGAGEPPSFAATRDALKKALALSPVVERGDRPSADIDAVRARVVLGALALSLILSLLVALRLRSDVTRGLASLDARLRVLATGQPSAREATKRPAELHALDDAADALGATLGVLREREQADRARSERVFALAERVDEIARGQLATRLPPSDDVAEASLAASVNRLVDAFERRVVRLKSHAELLAAGTAGGGRAPAGDDAGDDDPVSLVEKRVAGLRPIPPLLQDIAGRLATLARKAPADPRVPEDLARLSEAIAQRARAAQALFDSLEAQLPRLPRAGDGEPATLTADQRRALAKLVEDLEALAVDTSLPRLVESLPDLSAGDVASRLARAKAGA